MMPPHWIRTVHISLPTHPPQMTTTFPVPCPFRAPAPSTRAHIPKQVRRGHEDLRKRRLDEFMAGFNAIGLRLKEMYQLITLGGDAELELVDSLDPFAEGVLFRWGVGVAAVQVQGGAA